VEALALIAWSGCLAGGLHVVSGVDHLAALLPLSVGRRARAIGTGLRWGLGHSAGVVLVGLLAVALKQHFDVHAAGVWGERLVGVVLIALGLLGVRRGLRLRVHAHAHEHAHEHDAPTAPEHEHLHAHFARDLSDHATGARHHGHAAFVAGTLHGVAGTAHLLGVLPALALPGWLGSGTYLLAFALGTLVAMGAFAGLVGVGTARAAQRSPALARALMLGAGALTACVGAVWLALAAWPQPA
jgi:ABC-type nickel/cobalt efflux system permease component RcnA